ncbi:hypothetical protein ACH42_17740 [Endozoicomonas sp. (ex Bugula neritina AB1)]|nr:hypothetical protein ACH42_17740 [Endozoicomonas sp. (ex Bugula neritina AB1)]
MLFYSLVTVLYLYFTFRAASIEISRRHLHQSLQYAAVVDGNVKELLVLGSALQLYLNTLGENYSGLESYLNSLFQSNRLVTGVGVIHGNLPISSEHFKYTRKEYYWPRSMGQFQPHEVSPKSHISDHELFRQKEGVWWFVDGQYDDATVFRVSLLLSLKEGQTLRIDIDGAQLIQPLEWTDTETRLVLISQDGITIFANGISLPKMRYFDQFITTGPCDGFSKINITSDEKRPINQFIENPIKSLKGSESCSVFREALHRVVDLGESINFRVSIRNSRKWVTATPIPTTKWYFSISILEKDILAPLMNHILLSVSLIVLTMVLTLVCLWTVSGRITRPLNKLKYEMNAYTGDNEANGVVDVANESVSLGRSFAKLKRHIADRETALQQARSQNMGHLVQQLRGRYFYFNLSRNGEIIFVSPSISSVLGYKLWEFSGSIQDFLTSSGLNKDFSDTLESLTEGFWQEPFEVEMLHKDGSVRRIEMFCTAHESHLSNMADNNTKSLCHSSIEGMGNDITRRIKDTERFSALIAGAPDATVIINKDGIIGLVNREVLKLFSFEEGELINMPLSLLIEGSQRSEFPLLELFDAEQVEAFCLDSFLSKGISKTGRYFPIEISSNVLDTSEGFLISIVFRDISERVRIQGELVTAKEQAEKASQAKSMFLSNISHELRTPLNGVLGYAQLLLSDGNIPDRSLTNLKQLQDCGLHLLTLINDILDLTKIESCGIECDPQPYDLRATVSMVLANVKEIASSKHLELLQDVGEDIAHEVVGDNVKLRQVLINLLGNAVKFTESGFVSLKIFCREDLLHFEVRDTGIGIASEDIDNLFKPFSQLKAGRSKGGTGLGLAISYRLVNAMGGELQVASCPEEGSCFFFTTPYQAVTDSEPKLPLPPLDNSLNLNCHHSRILVADDNFDNRDMLTKALQSRGYQVDAVSDGSEAIKICGEIQYDLVLMDIKMPEIDGITATRIIHKLPTCSPLNVIAVSASVSDETRREISEAGFCEFVAKPINLESLFDLIQEYLQKKSFILNNSQRDRLIKVLRHSLDIGDVEALLMEARHWLESDEFGYFTSKIIDYCEALDMQSLESILYDLELSRDGTHGMTLPS